MNAGGSSPYCTVCRETAVLRIYSYLSPLDESGPIQERVDLILGESKEFFVQPMAPRTHQLKVDWTLQVIGTSPDQAPPVEAPAEGDRSYVEDDRAGGMWQREGDRAAERRADPLPEGNPKGVPQKATVKKVPGNAFRSIVTLAAGSTKGLPPGVYRLTARVLDDTRVPGTNYPWVIKDTERLREEWRSWTIVVSAPAAVAPPTPPNPPSPGQK